MEILVHVFIFDGIVSGLLSRVDRGIEMLQLTCEFHSHFEGICHDCVARFCAWCWRCLDMLCSKLKSRGGRSEYTPGGMLQRTSPASNAGELWNCIYFSCRSQAPDFPCGINHRAKSFVRNKITPGFVALVLQKGEPQCTKIGHSGF